MSEQTATAFQITALENVVDVLDHLRIPVNGTERFDRVGTVPYYGANGQQGWIDKPLFNEPLILLAEDGGNFDDFATRPIAYRIDGPAWVNNHAHIIRAKSGICQDFIFWSLVHRDIRRFIAGGTRTKLTQSELRQIELFLPEESERKLIAQILDTLDTTIRQTEAIIAKLQQVKQGLLHDLLTRGIDANGQLRPPVEQAPHLYKESPLGWIPREWGVASAETLLSRIIDYRGKTPTKTEVGVPLITAKNVRMGYIDPEPREFIAEVAYTFWMTRGIPNVGDVLFTTEAPLGNVAQIKTNDHIAFAQRVIILQPDPKVRSGFLKFVLMSEKIQRAISKLASGTTALGIKQSVFRTVPLPYPLDIKEQELIESKLEALDSHLRREQEAMSKLCQQKSALMDDLLTGRVRVTALLSGESPVSEEPERKSA